MSESTVAEDIAPGQVGLDEGNFFNGDSPLVFLVERPA
jgi:hypothetical protein